MRLSASLLALAAVSLPVLTLCAQHPDAKPRPSSDGLTAPTLQGAVHGQPAAHATRSFLGIPYAAPPVGPRRWQPPQPAMARNGVLDASQFGHHCYQFGGFEDMIFQDSGPSEDCLTLNIWTPSNARPGAKLPVMIWIHGGGYTGGGSSEPRHDAAALASHGVIVVTLNYRLGMLGFFTHPALVAESVHHAAGNYGLMDQAAAIKWVRDNIAGFGGDAKNLTVFGESAGSFSVSSLIVSPISKGMISRAIGESGASFQNRALPFGTLAERATHDAAEARRVLGTDDLAALRAISADDLVAHKEFDVSRAFPPDVDGYFLPDSVPNLYAHGQEMHIPMLAGWNNDEIRAGIVKGTPHPGIDAFIAMVTKGFGPNADAVLKVYPHATDAEAIRSIGDLGDDNFIVYSTWAWLEAHAETGAPVYRYRLDLAAPDSKFHAGQGAFHSDDIEYVFGSLDSRPGSTWRPEDRALTEQMMRYWTNFARTGDPNGKGLPAWPRYDAKTGWSAMHLDATSAARPDDLRERYLLLQRIYSIAPVPAAPDSSRIVSGKAK
ncbi:para-nitrobenzyl esterase [Bryocella elongata]|uniref:Carboxylic ester hydrolase n=1 Tax=Bryocella elongata TaxID=863522 RepID=A0A1H6C7A7_9BACT|nr:carboxylesterase family protein [Bryocella elongata]SEG68802.1 para-nitrobenzyl esterase [Bryocella elongata]